MITVVGSFKLYAVSYAVSTLSVVRVRLGRLGERLGSLRLSVPGFFVDADFLTLLLVLLVLLRLPVASFLVNMDFFTLLLRRGLLRLSVASFLVNMDLFTVLLRSSLLRMSVASVLVDTDFFTVLRGLWRGPWRKLLRKLGSLLVLGAVLGTT